MIKAYYNEYDKNAVAWLKQLIKDKLITDGDVDDRSILDVSPDDLKGYDRVHFFAGIGGWDLALNLAGWGDRPVMTGSCPCFAAGTLILTTRGNIPIEDVVPGDMVLTHTGKFKPVLNIQRSQKETIIVKGQGTHGIETTTEHPFYARTSKTDHSRKSPTYGKKILEDINWIEAQYLKGKYWATITDVPFMEIPPLLYTQTSKDIGVSICGNKWISRISVKNKTVRLGSYESKELAIEAREKYISDNDINRYKENFPILENMHNFATFLGYWLGDGWTSNKSKNKGFIFLCGGHDDMKTLCELADGIGLKYNTEVGKTGNKIRIFSPTFSNWLDENFGSGASTKQIPSWIFGQNSEFRQAFISGLLSADGFINGKHIGFSTTSHNVAIGVRILLNQQGIAVTMSKIIPNRICTIEGRIVNEKISYNLKGIEKSSSFKFADGHGWGLVRSITPTNIVKTVYNFEVADDNSYVADGIVVHNCQSFSTAGKGSGKNDHRHLWPTMFNLVKHDKPAVVMGEQVEAAIRHGWLDDVQNDLESENYAVAHAILGAHSVGSPHIRQRLYWLGHSNDLEHLPYKPVPQINQSMWDDPEWVYCRDNKYRPLQVGLKPLVELLPKGKKYADILDPMESSEARTMRLKGYGNAIVPQVAAQFIKAYMESINDNI